MLVSTTRFGQVQAHQEDIIVFPQGLIGFESSRQWLILPDPENGDVLWLQSLSQPQVALPLVSPRRFAADYKVGVTGRSLAPLHLRNSDRVFIMNVMSKSGKTLTINLRSPIVINLTQRLACQVITTEAHPLALPISLGTTQTLRMAA